MTSLTPRRLEGRLRVGHPEPDQPAEVGHEAVVLEWVDSPDFDTLLLDTVRATYPAAEHDRFVAHFRGLVGLWVRDAKAALQPTGGQPA